VELTPLPQNLRYEFLCLDSTYFVIVNANLNEGETEKLLKILKKYPKVIGYTIEDIKGINPYCACIGYYLKMTINPLLNIKEVQILT